MAKDNPYDYTTPDGRFPILVPLPLWNAAKNAGFDMRWLAVAQRIPTKSKPA
jgi:hypothetical protein